MPAVIPAEVQTSPSRMKMRSACRSTFGYRRAKASVLYQWVVARLPSRRPASASRKAPEQTLATRRARDASAWSQARRPWLVLQLRVPSPPATTMVSNGPSQSPSAAMAARELLAIVPPPGARTSGA